MRRSLLIVLLALSSLAWAGPNVAAQTATGPAFIYPMGTPGKPFGDGFYIRHGYATENTWYNPGYWHTGENWYALEGDTAGANVYAVADGQVVFAGGNYPGLVVIIRHQPDLYSMYGHLDWTLAVAEGDRVKRGDLIGTVLKRPDGLPSHLHFEIRTFFTTDAVNGPAPRYPFACGPNCPPGPGYWPMNAPEHPSALGWRNPVHVIAHRAYDGPPPRDARVVVAIGAEGRAPLWSVPSDHANAERIGDLALHPGDHYRLISIAAGPDASEETSAEAYRLWYRIDVPNVGRAWVQAAIPSSHDTGSDGRPSSITFNFLPAIDAA
jgi:murein DD-endopeptidase MepM/ murein hydrolase activator NlpD